MLTPTEVGLAEMLVEASKKKNGGRKGRFRGAFVMYLIQRHRTLEAVERIVLDNEIYGYDQPLDKSQIRWAIKNPRKL